MVPKDCALVYMELTTYLEVLSLKKLKEVPQKVKQMDILCDLAISVLSIYSRELKTGTWTDIIDPCT